MGSLIACPQAECSLGSGSMRVLFAFVFIVLAIVMLPVVITAVVALFFMEVNHSRLFAVGTVSFFFFVYQMIRRLTTDLGRPGIWALVYLLIAGGFFAWSYLTSPSGVTGERAPGFESVYASGNEYQRWHPASLVAERDQVRTALTLSGWLGGGYDDARGREAREWMQKIYDDLEYYAEELVECGSQLPACYGELLGEPPRGLHRYVYRSPKGLERERMPVLLLLHGSGGNLKAGVWAFKELADDLGMAIVAPTFGRGNWAGEKGLERIGEAVKFCQSQRDLDASQVVLAGYGTGGVGVSKAALSMRESVRGLVYVAADFTPETTLKLQNAKHLTGVPVLVMHGADDRLIGIEEVERAVYGLRRWKSVPVTFQRFDQEGALLLFHRYGDVCHRIASWMRSSRSRR